MRTGMQILLAAALLGASATAALAQGPYDDHSYWAKVERGQESAWGRPFMPYAPAFGYGPGYSRYYGPPAARERAAVARDVAEGVIDGDAARAVYGR